MENKNKLIEVKNLKKYFPVGKSSLFGSTNYLKAVDDISFYINQGETLGLVGESGCGKSTTGRSIIRMFDINGGEIYYKGVDISKLKEKKLKPYRRKMQVIFQDPYASLNPTLTVKDLVSEPLDVYHIGNKKERYERVLELIEKVGLTKEHLDRYPHEFSGGQRQRIGIARALSINPEFILCDEPISALDVSIQAQVVNMLEDLQHELGLTYLFIAHDLSMVRHISQRIGVMYLGKLVEIGPSHAIYKNPLHPYTKALLSSVLEPDPKLARENPIRVIEGDVPSPLKPPTGCRFVTRCKYKKKECNNLEPELKEVEKDHFVACHLY
ncbi:ATP-binding cassette domain-containing protein [Tissierella pigra]|uniref:ATP-binding cassette domain-containing protein n=1 Tax=Tissierella pigra TaxID=2607614 RepID=A0A6N7XYY1_9FIRM|nr:oligopeptide/dipeptide ABC transporter ATP-binding protein [Tissierella pigra]MBU5428040.1 ATP-binding cassette domain-containing protein [Tissierella pigra]MSU02663.1 ATP-binding cassette domain-containing protein [Tissierella pigra]